MYTVGHILPALLLIPNMSLNATEKVRYEVYSGIIFISFSQNSLSGLSKPPISIGYTRIQSIWYLYKQ